ncbi:MAG: hypothetical protein KAR42_03950, partial [candidate division Zixibacteria bacterium]|nr:hypothetical protein [candidate division Zixibacteria bacterium]
MKQNKLLILSLLASFMLLALTSYAFAANTVTFGTIDVCPQPAGDKVYVPVLVENDVDLSALDVVGQIVSTTGGVDLVVTAISFDDRMLLPEVLDQRYPIGDLGGGVFRLGAVKIDDADLVIGSGQIATLELEFVSDCLLGSATIDPSTTDCGSNTYSTIFVDTDANMITPDPVSSGGVNVVNVDPMFTNCPTTDFDIYWKTGPWGTNSVTIAFTADDPDLACGCDALTFGLDSGPGSINTGSGVYQFVAGPTDIGCHTVIVTVEDEYGGVATCEFDITVLNNPPEFTDCPEETINILWGQTATATVVAEDPDLGPSALVYTLESFTGPGSPMVDPITGVVTWVTDETNDFIGDFVLCVKVSDLAPSTVECPIENSDLCCFDIHVEPKFRVTIEKGEGPDGDGAYLGHYTSLSIDLDGTYESMEMGGYDFLITYDNSILNLVDAEAGALLNACGWEYFTYRHGYNGNCGTGCPSGAVRIVALAETNNGPYHPTCFSSTTLTQLAVLNFFVVNDHNYDCMYAPVAFFWMDCGDNTISSKYGDTLFIEDGVYSFEGTFLPKPSPFSFPSAYGAEDDCLLGTEKGMPIRAIDFINGGVDIICDSVIDDRGDINMDGIDYTVADAVMFTNYFIAGLSAFEPHVEGSIAASDANADGATLTVADLVYLIRVIQGDAVPYPKPTPGDKLEVTSQGNEFVFNTNVDAGAALLVFSVNGTVGTPTINSAMDIEYGYENGELRVLVYNIGTERLTDGTILNIPVEGTLELIEVEAADYDGNVISTTIRALPTSFDLAQNYPNPFNPT